MFGCKQDDPQITNIDPVEKFWMYTHWLADKDDSAELAKNTAYLLGSFWNPEAVRKLMGEGTQTHMSSEEEYDESIEIVKNNVSLDSLLGANQNPVQENIVKTKKKKRIIT